MDGFITNVQNPEELLRILKKIQKQRGKKCDCKNPWAKLRVCWSIFTGRFTAQSTMSLAHYIFNASQDARFAALMTSVMASAYEDYGPERWGKENYDAIKQVQEHKIEGNAAQDLMHKVFHKKGKRAEIKTDHRSGFGVINGGRDGH